MYVCVVLRLAGVADSCGGRTVENRASRVDAG